MKQNEAMEDLVIREQIDSELCDDGTLKVTVKRLIHHPISSITFDIAINKNGELE